MSHRVGKLPFDQAPERAGFVITAAVWKFDRGRWRLQQVCYEPRGRKSAEAKPSSGRIRRGAVMTEQGRLL